MVAIVVKSRSVKKNLKIDTGEMEFKPCIEGGSLLDALCGGYLSTIGVKSGTSGSLDSREVVISRSAVAE